MPIGCLDGIAVFIKKRIHTQKTSKNNNFEIYIYLFFKGFLINILYITQSEYGIMACVAAAVTFAIATLAASVQGQKNVLWLPLGDSITFGCTVR